LCLRRANRCKEVTITLSCFVLRVVEPLTDLKNVQNVVASLVTSSKLEQAQSQQVFLAYSQVVLGAAMLDIRGVDIATKGR
jgi:hypothetical protein